MKLLTDELRAALPALYSQSKNDDPQVVCKFFDPCGCGTWYAVEFDRKDGDTFFGLAFIHCAELGYFSLSEMEEYEGPLGIGIERDEHFKPCPLSEIKQKYGLNF